MRIIVKAYAILKERTGIGEIAVDLGQDSTVRDLIKVMSQRYGNDIESFLLTNTGEIDDQVLISHNDVVVNKADTKLSDGDLVIFVPSMAGG